MSRMPGLPTIGPLELLLILGIALLILGPGKLPEMGSAMGRTIREFRKASTDIQDSTSLTSQPVPNTLSSREADTKPRGTPADAQEDPS